MTVVRRHLLSIRGMGDGPGGVAPTARHDEAPALSNCRSSLCRDELGGLLGHRISICKYFNLHENVPVWTNHSRSGSASLRRGRLWNRLPPVPSCSARIQSPAYSLSVPGPQFAMPLRRSPLAQTASGLPP